MISLWVSFPGSSFRNITDAFGFGDALGFFEKTGITWNNRKGFLPYDPAVLSKTLEDENRLNFHLIERNGSYGEYGNAVLFRYEHHKQLQIFIFSFEEESFSQEAVNRIIAASSLRHFSFAFLCEDGKGLYQSEKVISNFICQGKPYEHLPRIWDPVLSPIIGSEVIDIFYNPGHMIETFEIAMMAAPEMWFGPNSWRFFDKNKVLGFPYTLITEELLNHVVHIKLFEVTADDYESEEILDIQKGFRKLTGMDEVELRLRDKIAQDNAK